MSKPVKQMIIDLYRQTFEGVNEAVLVDIRGISANDNNEFRGGLVANGGIRVSVIKNSLAKKAFEGGPLEPISDMLEGPSAIVHGGESVVNVARELIAWAKKIEAIEFKGAIMEGVVFGADEIKALSEYPTKDEAQAQVIQVVLGPAAAVIGAAVGIGNEVAGILKTLEEKLEKGEAITKVA